AVQRFDPDRGCRLTTYAMHWIRQAISHAVEQNDRMIHVPAQAAQELRRLVRLREEGARIEGRTPTEQELAEETGIPAARVENLLRTVEDAVSLDALIGPDHENPLTELTEDPAAVCPEQDAVLGLYRQQIRRLLGLLRPRERQVLESRYGFNGAEPVSLDEVGRQLRISRERVRQLEARAIRKLRYALRAAHWD
ncbi:MAG TPA: sigma-70 family RNA polymerase sigma factor, partial [Armatimonadota bacterium]|nr:sigma-70 family RNA polymerase sigma factor [Armatimonadota bacterium]